MEAEKVKDVEVIVRPVEAGDAERVVELIRELGYERTVEDVRRWVARAESGSETQETQATQAAFVACAGGEVVGWIEVSMQRRLQSAPFALIGGLVVKDGVRGRGIGGRLCEQAERWARQLGVEKLRVTSRSSREDAHRFYAREGYRQTKTSMVFEKQIGTAADEGSSQANEKPLAGGKSATIETPAKSTVADL
jgi:GNAT superfamily N-acetyltransferase